MTPEETLNKKFKDNIPSEYDGKIWDDKLIEAMEEYAQQEANKKFSEEEMRKCFEQAQKIIEYDWHRNEFCDTSCKCEPMEIDSFDKFIQSLTPTDSKGEKVKVDMKFDRGISTEHKSNFKIP